MAAEPTASPCSSAKSITSIENITFIATAGTVKVKRPPGRHADRRARATHRRQLADAAVLRGPGLIDARRGENGYREYDAEAPTTVAQIRGLLAAGLSTDAIRDLLPCAYGPEPQLDTCPELTARLRTEREGVEAGIETLEEHRSSALRRYLPR
jgi:hypothetical protein